MLSSEANPLHGPSYRGSAKNSGESTAVLPNLDICWPSKCLYVSPYHPWQSETFRWTKVISQVGWRRTKSANRFARPFKLPVTQNASPHTPVYTHRHLPSIRNYCFLWTLHFCEVVWLNYTQYNSQSIPHVAYFCGLFSTGEGNF